MAKLKINGFHTSVTGRTQGIGDFLRRVDAAGVPFLAYCVGGTTSLVDAQEIMRRSSVPHNAIFRQDRFPHNQGGSDVPDYNKSPQQAAEDQWLSHYTRWPSDLDPGLIWGETVNELRKEVAWADWIGEFCYETGLMALEMGWKWCGPGYSAGTPDEGAWDTPGMLKWLRLCAEHPDQLAVALHEYSLTTSDIMEGHPHLVGRFQLLHDACDRHGIRRPTIFFTEWGWAERDVPDPEGAIFDILRAGELYAPHDNIKGAAIWALDGGWGDLADKTHALMEPLARVLTGYRYDEPNVPPAVPWPTPPAVDPTENLLVNGSFEMGQNDHPDIGPRVQVPDHWQIDVTVPGTASSFINRKTGRAPIITGIGEVHYKEKRQIPEHEHGLLFLDGDHVLKIQYQHMVAETVLRQVIEGLEPGRTYRFSCGLQVHYQNDYEKPEPDDIEIEVSAGYNVEVLFAADLPDRRWALVEVDGKADEYGEMLVEIAFASKWQNSRDLFIDDCQVTAVAEDPDEPDAPPVETYPGQPRVQYRRKYHVATGDVTLAQWLALAELAYYDNRATMGGSYDDAGVGALTDKTAVLHDIPIDERQEFRDWYATWYPGTKVEFADAPEQAVPVATHWPTDSRVITQLFGANPANYAQFGLPGHEGIDIRCPYGEPYYAIAPGKVVKASDRRGDGSESAYGWHVVVEHEGGWTSLYAHATKDVPVQVGDVVRGGDVLAYSGNTGNSYGPHLHLTVKVPGYQLEGWPAGYMDPLPVIEPVRPPADEAPAPPPVTFPAKRTAVGLHAGADSGDLVAAEFKQFADLQPGVIKVMSSHSASSIERLAMEHRGAQWIIRAFLSFGGRRVTPAQFCDWTLSDTRRAYESIRKHSPGDIWIELHNEPNLTAEGFGTSWQNGGEFDAWLLEVLRRYRRELRAARFLYPGLSPGHGISGIRAEALIFRSACARSIGMCEGLGVHAYWSQKTGFPLQWAVDHVRDIARRYPDKAVWVTEASNNRQAPVEQKAAEYARFVRELDAVPNVRGVTYFVASASNPAWGWDEDGTGETWLPVGLAALVRKELDEYE